MKNVQFQLLGAFFYEFRTGADWIEDQIADKVARIVNSEILLPLEQIDEMFYQIVYLPVEDIVITEGK